ncbi:hypothetical protein ACHAWF_012483 [Thalassiosira exigua]
MGLPGDRAIHTLVHSSSLLNNPETPVAVSYSQTIYGPHRAGLRGETVQRGPKRVEVEQITIPRNFQKLHGTVTLATDIFFVNGVLFLGTILRNTRFLIVQAMKTSTIKDISTSLNKVCNLYARAQYKIEVLLMDPESQPLVDVLPGINVNFLAAREHVGKIEQTIRTIKERCREYINGQLVFKLVPH